MTEKGYTSMPLGHSWIKVTSLTRVCENCKQTIKKVPEFEVSNIRWYPKITDCKTKQLEIKMDEALK